LNFFKRLLKNTSYHVNDYIIDSGSLFSLSSAQITLETKLNLKSTGKAALGLKNVSGRIFAETVEEIKNFLDISKRESDLSYRLMNDSYDYIWIIFQSGRVEDIISSISATGEIVHDRGFSKQLFVAMFQFSNYNGQKNDQYLVYNYATNKFYPFVLLGKNERDNKIENEIMETVSNEIPFERDESLWYPIWNLTL
jgi:PspA associated protein B